VFADSQARVEGDASERDVTRAFGSWRFPRAGGRSSYSSSGVGLLSGARTAASASRIPQLGRIVGALGSGWLAGRWRGARHGSRRSAAPSPVNIRPVRLAPCAAGASPTMTMRARIRAEVVQLRRRGLVPNARVFDLRSQVRAGGTAYALDDRGQQRLSSSDTRAFEINQ
jgi:hypothetical protein